MGRALGLWTRVRMTNLLLRVSCASPGDASRRRGELGSLRRGPTVAGPSACAGFRATS
jgi:hypothetical protein